MNGGDLAENNWLNCEIQQGEIISLWSKNVFHNVQICVGAILRNVSIIKEFKSIQNLIFRNLVYSVLQAAMALLHGLEWPI